MQGRIFQMKLQPSPLRWRCMQKVCEGLRVEGEEQAALQQQLEQQQAQLTAADEQHAAAQAHLASLRLTALDGTPDKLLEQVLPTHVDKRRNFALLCCLF